MKPGYRVNDHCSIYSNDLYEAYNGRLRPDIYIGNGSEPPFSYLTSAINKKNVIAPLYICPLTMTRHTNPKCSKTFMTF